MAKKPIIKKTSKKQAKWYSDKLTLDNHKSKLPKDKNGFFKYTDEESCAYMRIRIITITSVLLLFFL